MSENEKNMSTMNDAIDEQWLRDCGFRWHEFERSGGKHWLLWIGGVIAIRQTERTGNPWRFSDDEDLGVEIAAGGSDGSWFCWLRSDTAHRYHRFIHLRHIWTRLELATIVEGLSGVPWNPQNHRYGSIHTDQQMERIRQDEQRPDRVLLQGSSPWYPSERDKSQGRPLIGHLEAAEICRKEHAKK